MTTKAAIAMEWNNPEPRKQALWATEYAATEDFQVLE